ncbi:MAG TPA: hypothetical protein VG452_08200 [Egibacteraceae bacterium]|nr:hypothetical protein [Egibacteraceae bacterium]
MLVDKQLVIEMFLRRGDYTRAELADDALPARIDLEEHAETLRGLGIDPGLLATQADNLEP